ncbi:hypothetical protein EJ08DRAFT_674528 [Tothia fuscella]|uniref:Uncharacterized protein n=1 Tax=Tothia fuscella TaxID=1048955 RepID=A0A9P4P3C7_9PEZI|nr:hypothetical protein EJ08DRAFT_674528 [Tothia fuscella]
MKLTGLVSFAILGLAAAASFAQPGADVAEQPQVAARYYNYWYSMFKGFRKNPFAQKRDLMERGFPEAEIEKRELNARYYNYWYSMFKGFRKNPFAQKRDLEGASDEDFGHALAQWVIDHPPTAGAEGLEKRDDASEVPPEDWTQEDFANAVNQWLSENQENQEHVVIHALDFGALRSFLFRTHDSLNTAFGSISFINLIRPCTSKKIDSVKKSSDTEDDTSVVPGRLFCAWPNNDSSIAPLCEDSGPTGFLDLPGEIRNRIYKIALATFPSPEIWIQYSQQQDETETLKFHFNYTNPRDFPAHHDIVALRETCQQVRAEFTSLCTQSLVFSFNDQLGDLSAVKEWLHNQLAPTTRVNIRHLELTDGGIWHSPLKDVSAALEQTRGIFGLHPDCRVRFHTCVWDDAIKGIIEADFEYDFDEDERPVEVTVLMKQGEEGLVFAEGEGPYWG